MKNIFLLSCLTLTCSLWGQNKIVERTEKTENGITKGWTITKELNQEGNIVSYDSSYYEKQNGDRGINSFQFEFDGNGNPNINFFNYEFDTLGFDNNFLFFNYPGGHIDQFGFSDSLLDNYRKGDRKDFEQEMKDRQKWMDEFFKKFQLPILPEQFDPRKEEGEPHEKRI